MNSIYKIRVMIYRDGHFWRVQWNYPRMKDVKRQFGSQYQARIYCEAAGWFIESVVE